MLMLMLMLVIVIAVRSERREAQGHGFVVKRSRAHAVSLSAQCFFTSSRISGNVVRLQQAGNDDDAFGASGDYLREIFGFDPADAKNGNGNALVDFANLREADGRVIGFGRSGEDWAEADVICPFALGGDGLFDAVS